ncbi:hypothetical protein [Paenibacillus herberti]|uniref:Uncharacterized protein n=1 Tax=Paenibacillus herberti TaxID=1619309 RepID=A0A229NZS0_9BACL|nr:hypothetical protein [Paenibacillus herberti]OXM15453.1 hypothetical protein CGZ75_01555 [Paenibacillus herberti]
MDSSNQRKIASVDSLGVNEDLRRKEPLSDRWQALEVGKIEDGQLVANVVRGLGFPVKWDGEKTLYIKYV